MDKSTAEIIVKVYAVITWITAFFTLIGALFLLGIGSMMGTMSSDSMLVGALGAAAGVFLLALGVFEAFVGWGLWKRQPWSRIAAIVVSVLSLFSFPVGTIIGAVGIWLFGFDETVKSLFGAAPSRAPAKSASSKKRQ
jgi:hypothetical protein